MYVNDYTVFYWGKVVIWGLKSNQSTAETAQLEQQISQYSGKIQDFLQQINQIILDKPVQTELALSCLLAGGHVLFEDLPGSGKTTLSSALAHLAGLKFQRIQFTNDMLASDIIGVNIFNQAEHQFVFRAGPVFSQIVLADEINRCSPKTQSALLEAMEENYVTVDAVRYALPQPFWVIATQNPLFQSGTYSLPESQLDRFLMRLSLGYPSREAEKQVLQQTTRQSLLQQLQAVFSEQDILAIQKLVTQIYLSDEVLDYVLDLAEHTRQGQHGLSTRGLLALKKAAQAYALVQKRHFVCADDVQAVFSAVVAHRLGLSERQAKELLQQVAIR